MNQMDSYRRKIASAQAKLIAIRNDAERTAARYDEIVKLRMFILDIEARMRSRPDPDEDLLKKIDKLAQFWGAKGDCV